MNPCTSRNGTYACDRSGGHLGTHRRMKHEFDSQNRPVARVTHEWTDSYGPVRTTRTAI